VIYVFYNNDPLAQDQGGGAEHFRGLHRALLKSGLDFHLVGSRLQEGRCPPHITYVSKTSNFLLFYLGLWHWFWANRKRFDAKDVFHFHRNYAAWPKLLLAPQRGRVLISYHNVTGQVLDGWLGRLGRPIRRAMLELERRVVRLADAIICVSGRDRKALGRIVEAQPFAAASVIPAAFDGGLFQAETARPPSPALAGKILMLGRISHQKNVPLALATMEELASRGEPFSLTIAGEGEDSRDLIRRLARSPARGQISWLGRVPHDRVPAMIEEHGILLLTSRYEASPTVVKEALKTMRPVVTTDVGDVADWLDEGRSGFIADADPGALADALVRARDLIRRGDYRQSSRAARLDEDAIMLEVVHLYRRLQAV
jgi:glycosyltransferase involved in cell wall biosynthesis